MSAVFFRLVHGVYTTLTLFILQPRQQGRRETFQSSPCSRSSQSLPRAWNPAVILVTNITSSARKKKEEKSFQCYRETEEHHGIIFCSNTSAAAALTNSRWRPDSARRATATERGPKVVAEKRLRGLLGSDSNTEARNGNLRD